MTEHDALELLRDANPIRVGDLTDPEESSHAQHLLPTILASRRVTRPDRHRQRLAFAIVGALVLIGTVVAVALFPRSSRTADGLSTLSTRGTPVSFAKPSENFATPYVLREVDGEAFFRAKLTEAGVERINQTFKDGVPLRNGAECYGNGKLSNGKLTVLFLSCEPFPSEARPVLMQAVGADVTSEAETLLFAHGFAADGVSEVRLVDSHDRELSTAGVESNVFVLPRVDGLPGAGLHIVAFDREGNEVWSGPA
jgi:hypothetical protein